MIYLFDDIEGFSSSDLEAAYREVSAERAAYARKYRFEIDRKQCVIAHLLLKEGLRREYGITLPVALSYSAAGKPFLRDYPAIHFNLSHCRRAVACAIADRPVGIDVEELQPLELTTPPGAVDVVPGVELEFKPGSLVDVCCSPAEKAAILASTNPSATFTAIWTRKEAYLKAHGLPLPASPSALAALPPTALPPAAETTPSGLAAEITTFAPTPAYYCSVCLL
jgi:4'-phosphopantetheinyl transferase